MIIKLLPKSGNPNGQVLTPAAFRKCCEDNIAEKYTFFVSAVQMAEKNATLAKRFASDRVVKGAKTFHRFVPLDSHTADAFKLSESLRLGRYTVCTTEGADEEWVCITTVPWEYIIMFFVALFL